MPSHKNSSDSGSDTATVVERSPSLESSKKSPPKSPGGVSLAASDTSTLVGEHAEKLPALPKLPTVEEFVKQTTTSTPWHKALLQKLGVPGIGKRSKPLQKVDDGLGAYSVNYKQYNDLAARHADMVKAGADPTARAAVRERAERVFVMAEHDNNAVRSALATWQQDKKQYPLVEKSLDAAAYVSEGRNFYGMISALNGALTDAGQVFRNGRSELLALRQTHSGLNERPLLPEKDTTLRFAPPESALDRIYNTNDSVPQPRRVVGQTLQKDRSDPALTTTASQAHSGPGERSRPNKLTKRPPGASRDTTSQKRPQRREGSIRPHLFGAESPAVVHVNTEKISSRRL